MAVAYRYALSKRTNLYTTLTTLRNSDLGTFGLNASAANISPPTAALGADSKVFNVGIRNTCQAGKYRPDHRLAGRDHRLAPAASAACHVRVAPGGNIKLAEPSSSAS